MRRPIIMPRSKKYGNNYWRAKGPKVNNREVILYSDLEFDHWVSVETNPTVVCYCEQEREIGYVYEDKLHSTIFDMWLKYIDGKEEYVEVKYSSELDSMNPKNLRTIRQVEAQRMWCLENGYTYRVVTENELRSNRIAMENRIKIVTQISNNKKPAHSKDLLPYITTDPLSIEHLMLYFKTLKTSEIFECVMWLLYEGAIQANVDEVILSKKTEVWSNE